MDIDLTIAGYRIRINEPANWPMIAWPLPPFERFITPPDGAADIVMNVEIVRSLRSRPSGSIQFDACHGLWKLFETAQGYTMECLDSESHRPRMLATINRDYSLIQAEMLAHTQDGITGWAPMQTINPVIEACLLINIGRSGGLLIHSSGLLFNGDGYIFTGPSGAGKSTLAQYFAEQGALVLSDERMILRQQHRSVVMHGTPWVGSGQYALNLSGSLTRLFHIHHGETQHHHAPLAPTTAISRILQQSFLPHWDRPAMESTVDFVHQLTRLISCSSLACLKDPSVVSFIQHRTTTPITV